MARPKPRECQFCSERFHPQHGGHLFCSPRCRSMAQAVRDANPVKSDRRCIWCGSRLNESMRSHAIYCSSKCRMEAYRQRPCIYCGEAANSRDHFIPTSFVKTMEDIGFTRTVIVPACVECNSTAGSQVFRTMREKRQYVHECYRAKYAKLLEAPDWSDDELNELGDTLRGHVLSGLYGKWKLKRRLRWPRHD